jgi:hypothetical protein
MRLIKNFRYALRAASSEGIIHLEGRLKKEINFIDKVKTGE